MGNLTILLVEDDSTTRSLLKRWITRCCQATVIEASDGLHALEQLSSHRVDLIMTDIEMPSLDGIEMLSVIRSDPRHKQLPVIVLSSSNHSHRVRQALQLGISDYILKPPRYEAVADRLQRAADKVGPPAAESGHPLPRVLVADPDANFCEFAGAALDGTCHVETVQDVGDLLLYVMNGKPDLVLVSPRLLGPKASFVLPKIRSDGSSSRKICGIADAPGELPNAGAYTGILVRTFVPSLFRAEVDRLLAGRGVVARQSRELREDREAQIVSAVRQVIAMMLGKEAWEAEAPSGQADGDLGGWIRLNADGGQMEMVTAIQCPEGLVRDMACAAMGIPSEEIDEDLVTSTLRDLLTRLGERLKRLLARQYEDVSAGLPELGALPSLRPGGRKEWRYAGQFEVDGEPPFHVSCLQTEAGKNHPEPASLETTSSVSA